MKTNTEHIKADAETSAIYKITDDANTPKDVKKFLLDYLFEKNGISVEFSEVETEVVTDGRNERIERDEEIRLTPARACELSEWIINQSTGIFTADAEDDRQKQALLILLSAIVYEKDMTKRENIWIDIRKKIFGYSFACDNAENQFIENGFEHWRTGKWDVQTNESE